MENTTSETMPEITQPTDRRKIRRALWRWNEDGTYNDKPNDPLYFKKYYAEKRRFYDATQIPCQYCNKLITLGHKARHEKTKSCIKMKNEKMTVLLG